MLFYFVRHGQTSANVQEILAGSGHDHPLTEEGHRQAEALALRLKKSRPAEFSKIVVSQMQRARQTAAYLAKALELPLQIEPDLREWHLGEWEGKPYSEFQHLLLGEGEPKTGESRSQFYARVEGAWRKVHEADQPYLIVSHGAVWLALQDLLKIPRFKVHNCDAVRVESQGGIWRAEVLKA
jgi:broad specificity phosphatase PhoE